MTQVRIFYTRPPAEPTIYEQELVFESDQVLITLGRDLELPGPKIIDGRTAMEPGSSIVWFTFPGLWHDIGKCYLRDGSFSGTYANVLTPVELEDKRVWRTTDLCLDVWIPPQETPQLLDQDVLDGAVDQGFISPDLARQAEQEAKRLIEGFLHGGWPPPVVDAWDLNRARTAVEGD